MLRDIGVLYAGELCVEEGPTEQILRTRHPYTVGLMRCLPRGRLRKDRGKLDTIQASSTPIGASLPGCVFVHRCGLAEEICSAQKPPDHQLGNGHQSRCFHERAQSLPRDTTSVPSLGRPTSGETPLLQIADLAKTFSQEEGHQGAGRRLGRALAG